MCDACGSTGLTAERLEYCFEAEQVKNRRCDMVRKKGVLYLCPGCWENCKAAVNALPESLLAKLKEPRQ